MLNKIPLLNNFLNKVIQTPEGLVIRWRIIIPVFALLLISLITLKHTGDTQSLLTSTYYKQYIWLGLGTFVFISLQWFRFQFFQ